MLGVSEFLSKSYRDFPPRREAGKFVIAGRYPKIGGLGKLSRYYQTKLSLAQEDSFQISAPGKLERLPFFEGVDPDEVRIISLSSRSVSC